ncbi:MAG: tetratricopeptide repeat protein [Sphingopyxis sp.]|uniref:tetratricopeptide repeat protein n=1 Tax=Sphingopyxis sp. TaxID=1908224 RepID=UPI002ABC0448|nr:tetratricopeptide repeat protein [Sphingopyxis sp.]MDZ3830798.1 tetratricopeptide repeat protein [Sphingopyxis sp.]
MMTKRSSRRLPALIFAMTMIAAAPAHSQTGGLEELVEGPAVSPDALAASEARAKAWFANADVQALKARADAGHADAQVAFADKIRDDLLDEAWSREKIQQQMLKYYGLAMAQNNGLAFARLGEIAELPNLSWKMKRSRNRSEAIAHYEKGAALGNREAIAGLLRIAIDPSYCSVCEDKGELKFDYKKLVAAGLGDQDRGAQSLAYRKEKSEVLARAIAYATPVRLRPGDAAAHLLAAKYLTGVQYPWRAGVGISQPQSSGWQALAGDFLLPRDTSKAIKILTELSMRGDNLASRKLASLYFTGKNDDGGALLRDLDKYIFYMDRAVKNGSVLAANDLGFELLSGRTLPADHARGFEYIAKAALQGYGPAELSAGYALRDGRGVAKNEAQALEMFKRAADHGEIDGAVQAAAMYRAGRGTTSGRVEVPNAYAYEKKAEAMRKLTPAMADLVRRANRDKFE